ncbi:hypothetical protein EDB92DRAFT_1894451 [Lactarius akahatsu]|uniref:NACHT domain-containing protein n=1 Tax=Lactarius akahatsu TaxID=416441 RepID=A0AAD4L6P7_9AGAM|nr:hypothetical protein EDB92DRAFT_1894451 [Lactarius akahatsu]
MSQSLASSSMPTSKPTSSNFKVIFENALKAYKKTTKQDLIVHPLASPFQACNSPAAILTILQGQVDQFIQSRGGGERLKNWLSPTISVLYAFSATIGGDVGLVLSPAEVVFAGASVLLLAAKDVEASQDVLIDVFGRLENFFRRLEVYIDVPATSAMKDVMAKIMIEVRGILGTATMEMKQSRLKKSLKVMGKRRLEDGLKELDKMTNQGVRMAIVEVLKISHSINNKVQTVIDSDDAKIVMQETAFVADDIKRRQLLEGLIKWQFPPDPSTNHNIASKSQHNGTTQWFFRGSVFEEWKVAGSLLWIHGKPGSGKSVLCSAIIQDIIALREAGLASMAYFYFDLRDMDKRSRRGLLTSFLVQLSTHSNPFCDVLFRLYGAHDDGARQPSDSTLLNCLKDMLTLPDQAPVYLILDALDECPNTLGVPSSREQVLELVKELIHLHLPSLRICVTSRPEVDIQAALGNILSHSVSLHDERGQNTDIADYITSAVHSDRRMRK